MAPRLTSLLLLASLAWAGAQAADVPADIESPAARAKRLEWFREAKYGLFIHWGLYAIPAGEWQGKKIPGIGEWIMNRAEIPVATYEKLAAQFNPVRFDADAWAKTAADAGMKYVVITAKHHDGFAMFDSKVSNFNVVAATPFKRDVVGELAAACAKRGLKFGVYYSQAQDWHERNGAGNTWDFGPDEKKDFDQYLQGKAEPQVRELLTRYGPLCLIWFDTPRMMDVNNRAKRFTDLVRSLQPSCLIDGRLGASGDYTSTRDNEIPQQSSDEAWETPATLNHTWGFRTDDTDWKRPGEVIFKLVDITSKGGNYLLNVGPRADGTLPERSVEVLQAVGQWLKINGEAVYGTSKTPFGEELGGWIEGQKQGGKRVWGERNDVRITTRPGKLYFTGFPEFAREGLVIPAMKNKVTAVYFLGDAAKKPIPTKANPDGSVLVRVPRPQRDSLPMVICAEFEGSVVERP